MKQIVQNYRTGEVTIKEVPVPVCDEKSVLIKTISSVISIGTEKSIIELGKKTLLGKAAARPDLLRRAIEKARKEGFQKTWQEALGRLDVPTPLGYSSSGIVIESGLSASEFSPGDRVACIGQGFASHAQYSSVPVNLAAKVPDGVSDEEAAFGMLGIIALHGIRVSDLTFGSSAAVVGLGLLGLITIQLLEAYGINVIAIDPDPAKVQVAKDLGFTKATTNEREFGEMISITSLGYGVDSVIITAASKSTSIVNHSIEWCRIGGRICIVGVVEIHPDRNELWKKEITLIVSKAAGPGSLDELYEEGGIDYPIEHVRWTQKRNLEEFLRLVKQEKINLKKLITHRFKIEEAAGVYQGILDGVIEKPIGVVLEYNNSSLIESDTCIPIAKTINVTKGKLSIGVLGAGLFGKAILLPELQKKKLIFHSLVTESGINADHNGARFGFSNVGANDKLIWDNPEINAVFCLTRHAHHAESIIKAIELAKPMFVEKPLCISAEELHKIREKAGNVDSVPLIFVGHNRRYSPHIAKIKNWLISRKMPMVITMRINAGHIASDHWVHSAEEGRSRIVGEMSHFLDLFQYLVGDSIFRVYAERTSGNNLLIVNNDNISVNMKFHDGSVGSLIYSAEGYKGYSRESLEIFYDRKTIHMFDYKKSQLYSDSSKISEKFETRDQQIGHAEELDEFINQVQSNINGTSILLERELATMNAIFAIEKSLAVAMPIYIS